MSQRLQRSKRARRWRGWLIPAALLALTPKCVLCLLAYAGLGGAFIRGAPELCGTTGNALGQLDMWLIGLISIVSLLEIFRRSRRRDSNCSGPTNLR